MIMKIERPSTEFVDYLISFLYSYSMCKLLFQYAVEVVLFFRSGRLRRLFR